MSRLRYALVAVLALAVPAACNPGDDEPAVNSDRSSTSTTVTTVAPSSTTAPDTTVQTTTTRPPTTAGGTGVTTMAEGDPSSVATALAASETAIRDAAIPVDTLEPRGREQQVAYRQLAAHPEWLPAVLDKLPPAMHGTVRANTEAGVELRALTKPRTELPPWRIVAPAPAGELLGYYKAAQAQFGIPWNYLAAIHLVETRMGRIRGASTAGAQGPMQFLPSTWAQYGGGGDINSNRDSIFAAARLLVHNGAPANMANALFNYNRSPHYVTAITDYAEQMSAAERAYFGYYHWQVYYRMTDGDRLLPVGYGS